MSSAQAQFREETFEDGAFRRQDSVFRDQIGSADFPAEAGRYHLYVSWACPWAHRTIIGRRLKGLEDTIGMSYVHPVRDARGWAFTGGTFSDEINGFEFLSEAYERTDPGYGGRVSVPVLWDKESGRIVNNESGEVLRMLDQSFGEFASDEYDLYPDGIRDEIDELNDVIYDNVNNGVYKAGFTTSQAIYEREVHGMFETLDGLDARLADTRYLFGERPVETDWRLFTTLARFDAVYYIHFKCSKRRLVDYENLWPYFRDLYQSYGIADTVKLDQIRAHYYKTHPSINPNGFVAVQPDADFDAPHGRG
ncbi:MAG TPA: glutathione S-transferase C-terminal domain-containing protein [Thermoleophilaceae bacterium]